MKKYILSLAAIMLATLSASAQKDAFGWMARENVPVYSAMAGASSVSSSDMAYAAFHNPAAMPYSADRFGMAASCYLLPSDQKRYSINAGVGFLAGKRVGISVAANYNLGAQYEQMDEDGNSLGTFKTSSMMFSAGVGVRLIRMLSLGVNLKYAMERLQPKDNPGAFASDIYCLFRLKGLGATVGVANLGTKVKDVSGQAFSLPASVKIGVGYAGIPVEKHFVEANLDVDCYFSSAVSAAIGAQYGWNKLLFVRAGYRYSSGSAPLPSYISSGLGVRFYGIHIDASYIYVPLSKENCLSLGLGYSF